MTDMNFRSDIIERSLPMVSSQAPIRKHPTQSSPYEEESVYRVSTENPLHSGVAISFHKNDRIYRVNDILSGHITILSKDGWNHKDINLQVRGEIKLTIPGSAKTVHNLSTLFLLCSNLLLKKAGKISSGTHQIPFSFPVHDANGCSLLESYNGSHVNISYILVIKIERGFFQPRPLESKKEFIVQLQKKSLNKANSLSTSTHTNPLSSSTCSNASSLFFQICPTNDTSIISPATNANASPEFKISGVLHEILPFCNLSTPLGGEIIVEKCDLHISNIEIQLIRSECVSKDIQDLNGLFLPSLTSPNMQSFHTTNILRKYKHDVLNLEIAHGNVCRNTSIPIYIIFPRLKTCATCVSDFFCIEYELNIIISFECGHSVTKSIPLALDRG